MAHVWPLHAIRHGDDTGWIVEEFKMVIISQGDLFIPFGSWGAGQLSLPSAKCIFSMFIPVVVDSVFLKSPQALC